MSQPLDGELESFLGGVPVSVHAESGARVIVIVGCDQGLIETIKKWMAMTGEEDCHSPLRK